MTYEEAIYYLEHASQFGIQMGLAKWGSGAFGSS